MESLLRWYMPLFYIHSKEIYNSMKISDFVECHQKIDNTLVLQKNCDDGTKYELQVIANIVEHRDRNNSMVCDFVYALFFPKDMKLLTVIQRFKMGRSQMICGGFPSEVNINGKWYGYRDSRLTMSPNGRLRVFVSKQTHNLYPNTENHKRCCLFSNDECDMGYTTEPQLLIYEPCNSVFNYLFISKKYRKSLKTADLTMGGSI